MLRILRYVLKNKLYVFIGTVSMMIVIGIDIIMTYMNKIIVDEAILPGDFELLIKILGFTLVIVIAKSVLGYVKEYFYDKMSAKVSKDLKKELFEHIQTQEFGYFDKKNTGELMSRIGEDVDNIWQTVSFGLRLFIENIIYFMASAVVIFTLNWKLALICIVTMLPVGLITIKLEKGVGGCYGKISDQTATINTTAQEDISGIRLIKAFSREKYEIEKFLKLNQEMYQTKLELCEIEALHFPRIEFLTNLGQIAMLVFGGILIVRGEMTLGVLAAFGGYLWNIIWPLRMLGWLTDMISRTSESAKKIFEILDRKPMIKDGEQASKSQIEGEIEYGIKSFTYDNERVLENIDLKITKNMTVALMGGTGSGKSTLLSLMGRYYDIEEGYVKVDGVDVRDYNLNHLRSHISIVPQDTFLFSDTILDNIKYGNMDATLEEVKRVCEAACILDFIESLEEGFNTVIGERGLGLSGGQKQRLAIARALLKKAPILILDDATSALDMETEYELLNHLKQRNDQATTFIVAHRISAVKNADLIIYMSDGTIVEAGTHNELLELKGNYYEIYKEQFKSFEDMEVNE